jgi:hypothetical protein
LDCIRQTKGSICAEVSDVLVQVVNDDDDDDDDDILYSHNRRFKVFRQKYSPMVPQD